MRWSVQEWREFQKSGKIAKPKANKYGAKKTVIDGITFDSKKEAARYQTLRMMLAAGKISDLKVHHPFSLYVRNVRCGTYEADFVYFDQDGKLVVEDVKSSATRTALYRFKRKVFTAIHGIEISEA